MTTPATDPTFDLDTPPPSSPPGTFGTFPVTSGRVVVTDPAQPPGNGLDLVARDGEWRAGLYEGHRFLLAHHTDVGFFFAPEAWQRRGDVTVNTGQAGVFDGDQYTAHGGEGEASEDSSFYGRVCALTLDSGDDGGVLPEGAVALSIYGEGVYSCDVIEEDGVVIAVRVDFDPVDDLDYDDGFGDLE
jgi:hypothetical protein